MAARLQSFACSVVRLGHSATGCGLRLPATADRLSRLREQLNQFDALPYSCSHRHFQTRDGSFTATQALPVVAERLSLPDRVQDFDPRPYLSPTFRHIYEDPDAFLKPEAERPEPIKIRGTASRRELLKVLERWDHLGRLFVCDSSEVRSEDRCELFAVAKDADKDRQILHRKRRNLQERHIQGASRDLPHGVLLCQLPLEGRYVCACSVDDVKDFYHAYPASEARARSSPVGPVFRPGEVSHLKAFQEALAAGRVTQGGRVACCFKGLGMGDHAAVDIAQESHVNLLRSFGAMKEGETLRYRDPVPHPPSGFVEGIMIDDHLGLQLLPRLQSLKETLAQPARDQEVFAASGKAYSHAGLQAHPKKAVRRGVCAKVWGAEIEGEKGLVGPVRSRLMALGRLSSEVARPGAIDQQTLDGVLGLWGFCAQFRRPIFSFLYEAYRQQGPGTAEEPFRLSTGARNEFAVLACLAPLCLTDLHVLPDKYLYCVDASPSGAGVCRSEVGVSVVREIWRRGDKQGYRMPLLSRLSAALKESGLDEDDVLDEQDSQSEISDSPLRSEFEQGPVEDDWRLSIPPALKEGPWDFLELYSGVVKSSFFGGRRLAPRPPSEGVRTREHLLRGRVTEKTHQIRTSLIASLEEWLLPQLPGMTLETLARGHSDVLSDWLEEYMVAMFLQRRSRRAAAETLNALAQRFGWLRSSLAAPWNLVKTWEQLEPVQHHPPVPKAVNDALVVTALLWRWPRMAALLVLGFFGLLRPSELIGLRRQDLALPGDHFEEDVLYIRVPHPKTRFRAATSQHVRVEFPGVATWITLVVGTTPMWRRIWNGSWASFKLRFGALQTEVLGAVTFLPSSLRPGGATFLFRYWDEDLTRLQWRGRWKSFRMLETYVQELGATE
ncbi:unnamed protein product, partial [Symbiodinium natans]